MDRPSKKDIKAAIDKLKENNAPSGSPEAKVGKLPTQKTSKRIRKQGV